MNKTRQLLKWLFWLTCAGGCAAIVCAAGIYLYLSPKLPSVDSLRDTQLQIPLRVYTTDGLLMGEFGEKRRTPVNAEDMPQDLINAILAAEDDTFLSHHGVDIKGLLRAAGELASTGSIQSGGSTITMQVAKNYFLTRARTFERKFTEILLALHIERELSKPEILELYLNKIFLGNRAYGIGAAAQAYYGKTIDELDLAQLAMMAGLPQAPSVNNPLANPERARGRRDWILSRMLRLGYIDQAEYQQAIVAPVTAKHHSTAMDVSAPWVAEMARAQLYERFGAAAYTEGYRVTTTVQSHLQNAANQAVMTGLDAYDDRHGYRKPEGKLAITDSEQGIPREEWQKSLASKPRLSGREAVAVIAVQERSITVLRGNGDEIVLQWDDGLSTIKPYLSVNAVDKSPSSAAKIFAVGDIVRMQAQDGGWRLRQVPDVQAAFISLNPGDGAILAMVGGANFQQSKFNRVIQARRQPGSAFKPFLYASALNHGFTPASIINDAPVVFDDDRLEETWRPVNSSGRFYGPTRLRKALYLSRNLVSIRLLRAVGINNTIDYVKQFGFQESDLPRDLSLALGTLTISPLELISAYAILANGGFAVQPYLVSEIVDANGATVHLANNAVACPDCASAPSEEENNALVDTGEAQSPAALTEPAADNRESTVAIPGHALGGDQPINYAPKVMDERVHYLIDSMLKDVVKRGTATRANALGRNDLAGKTGTTNGPTDAWFSGYNRDIVTTVWFGFDQNQPLGRREFGGSAALPVWMDFMRVALEGKPNNNWEQPDGFTMVRIDPTTGLLARPGQGNAIFEIFRSENTPEDYAHPEQGRSGSNSPGGLIEEGLF
jgi:penicillin-binding protein 1A